MRGSNDLPLSLSYNTGITTTIPCYRYSCGRVIAFVIVVYSQNQGITTKLQAITQTLEIWTYPVFIRTLQPCANSSVVHQSAQP